MSRRFALAPIVTLLFVLACGTGACRSATSSPGSTRSRGSSSTVSRWPPIVVWVDPETGCHFYRTGRHGEYLIPRRTVTGYQRCDGIQPVVPTPGPRPSLETL
jgi:hypothetical protein